MEVLEERRADGVDGNEKVSNAFAGKDTKGRTDRAYWVIRCRSSKVTAFLISIVAMQIVSMVAKGSLANPTELKNQTQDKTANCTDSHRPLPDGQWATSANESTEYAGHSQNRTGSGRRSLICNHCSKNISCASRLKIHIRTHTGKKPYKCIQCDKRFRRLESLRVHCRVHTGEKPFKCDRCNSSFGYKASLRTHMRIHTGERPFRCDRCNSSFGRKEHLQTHMRIHTGEKPFKCDHCNSSFSQKSNLRRHMQTHTNE